MTDRLNFSDVFAVGSSFEEKLKNDPVPKADFSDFFWKAYYDVNALQKNAEERSLECVLGNADNFHEAVIAMEKASLALQLLVQMQNKLVDAYQEIMRMNI